MRQRPAMQDEGGGTPAEKRHTCTASLYQRYAPALFEYIRRHTENLTDAEDILADVFIGALRSDLSVLNADEKRAWLWTVARNKISDYYRQARRRPLQVSLDALLETLEDGADPAEIALQSEEAAYLRAYLRNLSQVQQDVLQLRFISL